MNGRYQHMMGNTGGANANSYYAAASSSRQYNSPRGEVEYFEVEEGRPMQLERRHSRMVKINR
jgi:hypothetical protein